MISRLTGAADGSRERAILGVSGWARASVKAARKDFRKAAADEFRTCKAHLEAQTRRGQPIQRRCPAQCIRSSVHEVLKRFAIRLSRVDSASFSSRQLSKYMATA